MSNPKYSVVVPVYNSDRSLTELADRISAVFNDVLRQPFEIIFVDDHSLNENTWETLGAIAARNGAVRAFRLARNFGQGRAVMCGMSKARGDWIITMDDDLQHRPEDIPLLVESQDHDVVIGSFPVKQGGTFKRLSSNLKGYFDHTLLGLPSGLDSTSFKLIKRRVVDEILEIRTPRPFIIAMLLAATHDIVNVAVQHEARKFGQSNYSLRKSLSLFSSLLINNSSFLLRLMSMAGFWITLLSFAIGLGLIVRRLILETAVPGWTSLIVVILLSMGFIIFCLGIVGEYLWRLVEIAERRPTYSVQKEHESRSTE